MDNEVVRITVDLRTGLSLCHPHLCFGCGAQVGEHGIHSLHCHCSKGHHSHLATLNDISNTHNAAKVLNHLEPSGLHKSNGKIILCARQ